MKATIYDEMIAAGVPVDSYESDLYVPVNDTTRAIVARYASKEIVTTFQSDGKQWYDIPFAYAPWWEKRKVKP